MCFRVLLFSHLIVLLDGVFGCCVSDWFNVSFAVAWCLLCCGGPGFGCVWMAGCIVSRLQSFYWFVVSARGFFLLVFLFVLCR